MTPREKQALQNFAGGMNCAQSVLCAYADKAGLTTEQAAMVASGFGGGMGRLRQNCGAYSAAVMLCGAMDGPEGAEKSHRAAVYARVQAVNHAFIDACGTICCAELLGRPKEAEVAVPDARTPAYYASRPCARIIRKACGIIEAQFAAMEEQD